MPASDTEVKTVAIENLKLACWLLFNKQQLVERELLDDGRIRYLFKDSPDVSRLVEIWSLPERRQPFSFYASIVSSEIRRAVKLRRSRGMPLRLRSTEK